MPVIAIISMNGVKINILNPDKIIFHIYLLVLAVIQK